MALSSARGILFIVFCFGLEGLLFWVLVFAEILAFGCLVRIFGVAGALILFLLAAARLSTLDTLRS